VRLPTSTRSVYVRLNTQAVEHLEISSRPDRAAAFLRSLNKRVCNRVLRRLLGGGKQRERFVP